MSLRTAGSRHPDSVLLDRKAYLEDQVNATTAVGQLSTGEPIRITFSLADPPAVSYFCIHSPEISETDYASEPVVACSEKDMVIIHFSFRFGPRVPSFEPGLREYFIYRAAGCGKKPPSFKPIPYPGPDILMRPHILHHESLGLVPFDNGEFLLVSLSTRMSILDYVLLIFSSKTEQWTTKQVVVQTTPPIISSQSGVPFEINKVIVLGEGLLGWVDLWRGILVCNVLEDSPVVRIIPLPNKPKSNFRWKSSSYFEDSRSYDDSPHNNSPNLSRDVACNNGLIKLIDMEHLYREEIVTQVQNDLASCYDSHLVDDDPRVGVPRTCYVSDGWRLRSYYKHISSSSEYWREECIVHCDDISVYNPRHCLVLPELRAYNTGKLTLRYLISAFPFLSIHGENVVYLMSKVKFEGGKAWILGVDLANKTLEVLEPYSSTRAFFFKPDLCHYMFSKYLNPAPPPPPA
uniref:Uncharacterized protein n=1 Tax=Avena sativa TaxID=4498 RepID=A0ACD5XIE9_AVESA